MTYDNAVKLIQDSIAENLYLNPDRYILSDTFEDLDADSMDLAQIMSDIESKIKVEVKIEKLDPAQVRISDAVTLLMLYPHPDENNAGNRLQTQGMNALNVIDIVKQFELLPSNGMHYRCKKCGAIMSDMISFPDAIKIIMMKTHLTQVCKDVTSQNK